MEEKNVTFDDFDEARNPKPEYCDFDHIVERAMSRRTFTKGLLYFGSAATLMGAGALRAKAASFPFENIPASTKDTVVLPEGYSWSTLIRWGDPLWSHAPAFDPETRGSAASQVLSFGDNTDGMDVFDINGKTILVVNNEYTNLSITFGNRESKAPETDDDVDKGKMAHGVSVLELKQNGTQYTPVIDSPYNRRITPDTPMVLSGPAAGHELLKTSADPIGRNTLGTWNNCGNGATPWKTYLACEENFNGYFSSSDPDLSISPASKRYGIGHKDWGYAWAKTDDRFNIAKNPNEPNRCGYVVEIDPAKPDSKPVKRTALGRFKHENAEVVIADGGQVVVYMGDDERGEFLYKYVSKDRYEPGGDTSHLLDEGTLYAAVFSDDQTGQWVPLIPETTQMSPAEICIHTRIAASTVGATTMDRPEWVAINPVRAEAYCALTNNKNRGIKTNAGGDPTPVGGPNPREANNYGQIVRWYPENGDHANLRFTWDLFVMAGNPEVHTDARRGSKNVNQGNMFNSPDGMSFDRQGLLWIQTDGNYSNSEDFLNMGNNQMLVGDPATGEIRRFLVGPNGAEITGLCWSKDYKTMFVGVQHPGEDGSGTFPDGGLPRSCIIMVRRDDNKEIG